MSSAVLSSRLIYQTPVGCLFALPLYVEYLETIHCVSFGFYLFTCLFADPADTAGTSRQPSPH